MTEKIKEEKEMQHIPIPYDIAFWKCDVCSKDLLFLTEEEMSSYIPRSKLLEIVGEDRNLLLTPAEVEDEALGYNQALRDIRERINELNNNASKTL